MTDTMMHDSNPSLPRIPLNPWDHKLPIALHWTALLVSGGALPIALYFALRYGANLQLSTVLGITTAIFGVVTLFSLVRRTWLLLRRDSTCRPIGGSRWQLDFFNWNFMIGFTMTAIIIIIGNVTTNVRIVALGLPVLLLYVCGLMLTAGILAAMNIPAPVRMSSVPRGDRMRSGAYVMAEDIVAVDGGQGQVYREQLKARYFASGTLRRLCFKLDIVWGVSGLVAAGVSLGLLFGLSDKNLSYILGWVIPWAYAGIMATFTIIMVKTVLRNEQADPVDYTSARTELMMKGKDSHDDGSV